MCRGGRNSRDTHLPVVSFLILARPLIPFLSSSFTLLPYFPPPFSCFLSPLPHYILSFSLPVSFPFSCSIFLLLILHFPSSFSHLLFLILPSYASTSSLSIFPSRSFLFLPFLSPLFPFLPPLLLPSSTSVLSPPLPTVWDNAVREKNPVSQNTRNVRLKFKKSSTKRGINRKRKWEKERSIKWEAMV